MTKQRATEKGAEFVANVVAIDMIEIEGCCEGILDVEDGESNIENFSKLFASIQKKCSLNNKACMEICKKGLEKTGKKSEFSPGEAKCCKNAFETADFKDAWLQADLDVDWARHRVYS